VREICADGTYFPNNLRIKTCMFRKYVIKFVKQNNFHNDEVKNSCLKMGQFLVMVSIMEHILKMAAIP